MFTYVVKEVQDAYLRVLLAIYANNTSIVWFASLFICPLNRVDTLFGM